MQNNLTYSATKLFYLL